jgi:hypothetical protein
MQSPLALDKETVKKYKITQDMEPTPLQKLAFLREQLDQIKSMQWRARVDVIHATRLSESDNEILKNKGLQNKGTHLNEVEQSAGAIAMTNKFIEELIAEYPELQPEE